MDDRVAGVALAIVIIVVTIYIVWSTASHASCGCQPCKVYNVITGYSTTIQGDCP